MYDMNCVRCGGRAVSEGESYTLLGFIAVKNGHRHDDNARTRVYRCQTCNHMEVLSLINRCKIDGCDWVGETDGRGCNTKVPRWPDPYSPAALIGSIPGQKQPSCLPVVEQVQEIIKGYLTSSYQLQRFNRNIELLKQQMCDQILLLLCHGAEITWDNDMKKLHEAIRGINAAGRLNLDLVHDHGLFELVEQILLEG